MQDELSDQQMDEIIELIYDGQKIAACKRYMEHHNQQLNDMPSLLTAKKFIEELTDELKAKYPDRFTNERSGCFPKFVAGGVIVGVAAYWLLVKSV